MYVRTYVHIWYVYIKLSIPLCAYEYSHRLNILAEFTIIHTLGTPD